MRVASISDIHGNLPALEAVLEAVGRERPDLIVCCGDVASGPMPAETIDRLMALENVRFVRGNADRGLVDEFDGKPKPDMPGPFAEWCAKQISRRQRDFLASFESKVTVDGVDGLGTVLFCHATPRNDTDVMTVDTPPDQMRFHLRGTTAGVVICGHTHMQFDRMVVGVRIVNAGSVGMPYGTPGAYWAMLGSDVDLKKTPYDRDAAAKRIREKDWPFADQFVTENVLTVPSAEEATGMMLKLEAKQAAERG